MTTTGLFYGDGIHAGTGRRLNAPLSAAAMSDLAAGGAAGKNTGESDLLRRRVERGGGEVSAEAHYGVADDIDPSDLSQTGWAVIFPQALPGTPEAARQDAIRAALAPLLQHRQAQAAKIDARWYQEFSGARGVRPGDTNQRFLGRLKVDAGAPADPRSMPYYLLLVGSPVEIPFSFQVQLDITYAVGRIHFETDEEYANYARNVVEAETHPPARSRTAAFFGVLNPFDEATELSRQQLVVPLADALTNKRLPGWTLTRHLDAQASKSTLTTLLGGAATPALLFTASHGVGFDATDVRQRRHQGALLCSDWQNPDPAVAIAESLYVSRDDIAADARLRGLIAFNFACYGAGTPAMAQYPIPDVEPGDLRLAAEPFVSGLHQRLLGHPQGALAAIGHIERVRSESLPVDEAPNRITVFESALARLMKGLPVGWAMEPFNARYAQFGADLAARLADLDATPGEVLQREVAQRWIAHNDARDYVVTGDPAVRLSF